MNDYPKTEKVTARDRATNERERVANDLAMKAWADAYKAVDRALQLCETHLQRLSVALTVGHHMAVCNLKLLEDVMDNDFRNLGDRNQFRMYGDILRVMAMPEDPTEPFDVMVLLSMQKSIAEYLGKNKDPDAYVVNAEVSRIAGGLTDAQIKYMAEAFAEKIIKRAEKSQ